MLITQKRRVAPKIRAARRLWQLFGGMIHPPHPLSIQHGISGYVSPKSRPCLWNFIGYWVNISEMNITGTLPPLLLMAKS